MKRQLFKDGHLTLNVREAGLTPRLNRLHRVFSYDAKSQLSNGRCMKGTVTAIQLLTMLSTN